MSWTDDDDLALAKYVHQCESATGRGALQALVELLLIHGHDLTITCFEGQFGVALPIDLHFGRLAQAEELLQAWQDVLDQIRERLSEEDA